MNPVRNHKLTKKMIAHHVAITRHKRQPLMQKAFCF